MVGWAIVQFGTWLDLICSQSPSQSLKFRAHTCSHQPSSHLQSVRMKEGRINFLLFVRPTLPRRCSTFPTNIVHAVKNQGWCVSEESMLNVEKIPTWNPILEKLEPVEKRLTESTLSQSR